jgi:hypothetical protein
MLVRHKALVVTVSSDAFGVSEVKLIGPLLSLGKDGIVRNRSSVKLGAIVRFVGFGILESDI